MAKDGGTVNIDIPEPTPGDGRDTRNIHQRIHAAQRNVGEIQKHQPSGMKYPIISHDEVTAKVSPALHGEGIIYSSSVVDHGRDGNLTWALVKTTFYNVDNPSDCIESTMLGYGVDREDKGPGKAISYAVKYTLLKMMSKQTGDDPENEHIPAVTEAQAKRGQQDAIGEMIEVRKMDKSLVKESCGEMFSGRDSLADLSVVELEDFCEHLENCGDMYTVPEDEGVPA